jgi:hypothetical protein
LWGVDVTNAPTGLNIFNTKYLVAEERTSTDDDFLNVERVVGHEVRTRLQATH